MIREFAFGITKRHNFMQSNYILELLGNKLDTYMSLWEYDESVKEYFNEKKTIANYPGKIYIPKEFILDVDGQNPKMAQNKAIGLTILLNDLEIPYKTYFSGRGFHLHIPNTAFRWEPCDDLHIKVKEELTRKGIFEYADVSVTDKTRLIRVPNTRNMKSGKWKIEIEGPNIDIDTILENAKTKDKNEKFKELEGEEVNPVFDCLIKKSHGTKVLYKTKSHGRNADPVNYPCISKMLEGTGYGGRHAVALRLSAWFRWLYPESTVRNIMEQWRLKVASHKHPFTHKEMDNIVESAYSGHSGAGNRYGCQDSIMDKYCSKTCRLFRAKDSQNVMTADKMEAEFLDFLQSDLKPIDIGKIYGESLPIYPGEVVLLQAPPKCMKTMLLQNWVYLLKKKTYFLELEMSSRQMWQRFLGIHSGYDEKKIKEAYKSGTFRGISKHFQWLTVDYSPCYAGELRQRIQMLPEKPEIVIVDHMGLFRSQQRDANMKVEEVSQSLMELAIQENVIVIAISEINKSSFKDGMDIASSKGSFRVAYNANKILGLTPHFNNGIIIALDLKTIANREKETLNTVLSVNNTRIGQAQSVDEFIL